MDELFDKTKKTLENLVQLLDPLVKKKKDSTQNIQRADDYLSGDDWLGYGALYDYYDRRGEYKEYLTQSQCKSKEEKLFIDFWYQGSLMSVACFIPETGALYNHPTPIAYRDLHKSSEDIILQKENEFMATVEKIHQIILFQEARIFANSVSKPLLRLGYKGIIKPGDDLPSIYDRLVLLQKYAALIEESIHLYGLTDMNPLLIRAKLDTK